MPVIFGHLHVYFSHLMKWHNKCEECLIKEGTCTAPFLVEEMRNGALKGVLIPTDYTAPMEVIY